MVSRLLPADSAAAFLLSARRVGGAVYLLLLPLGLALVMRLLPLLRAPPARGPAAVFVSWMYRLINVERDESGEP